MELFLCEKPSQGKDIAAVLGAKERRDGFLSGPGVAVTWGIGHLLEQAQPEAYGPQYGKPWRMDALPVIPDRWQMQVKPGTAHQFNVVASLLKQVDSVVIATDADREGEVIAREILDHCGFDGPVRRLWLSALDEASIRAALECIRPGEHTESLYQAGLCRARADWLIGMNLTRLFTLKAAQQGYSMLSVGRVQSPTLALVVNREREIAGFKPAPFWTVDLALTAQGMPFTVQWVPAADYCDEQHRCVNEAVARQVAQLCQQAGQATVITLETRREKQAAPLAFDLGGLQQACSKKWGLGAQQVLDIAQSLYETHKATTYPRTDCGYLPVSMRAEVPRVLAALAKADPTVAPLIDRLQPDFGSRIWNDKKITAHHGIIPTRQAPDLSKMSETERNVYQLIRLHYLMQFLPLHEVDATVLTVNCSGQLFKTNGKVVAVPGWKALQATTNEDEDGKPPLPALRQGETCAVSGGSVKTQHTRPPERYTEGTLIAAMKNAAQFIADPRLKKILKENAGLGTEATRAGIIETLLNRGFLVREKKYLGYTPTAGALIDALPPALKDPATTALWEQALDEIAEGKRTLADFMERQAVWTRQLVEKGKALTALPLPPTPRCPLCGSATQQRKGKEGMFWGCVTYPECKGGVDPSPRKKKATKGRSKKPPVKFLFSSQE
ncbi:DNA topoisomerase III [Kosakonia cowanii]|nr:DNA topoisomerase III [Kosakonia cowanii]